MNSGLMCPDAALWICEKQLEGHIFTNSHSEERLLNKSTMELQKIFEHE